MYLMHLLIDTKIVTINPMLYNVSAVPLFQLVRFQQLRWIAGESDTTTIPKRVKKSKKSFMMLCRIQTDRVSNTGQK
jgi:hypothetical protein